MRFSWHHVRVQHPVCSPSAVICCGPCCGVLVHVLCLGHAMAVRGVYVAMASAGWQCASAGDGYVGSAASVAVLLVCVSCTGRER